MTARHVHIRPLAAADQALLWDAIYYAIHVPQGESPPPRQIINDPAVARYVAGWGRRGDLGFVASTDPGGKPLGACWVRLWHGADRGYGYVDDTTPELTLAVWPGHRGLGTGTKLLGATLKRAARDYPAVSLSVTSTNPAIRLYERTGFHRVGEQGSSVVMVWRAPQVEATQR